MERVVLLVLKEKKKKIPKYRYQEDIMDGYQTDSCSYYSILTLGSGREAASWYCLTNKRILAGVLDALSQAKCRGYLPA